ncbi:hypothetical protein CDL12_22461 [Handroanthus impetiginosus]|uniref:Uncharacterized protein n=1 Tax=Handroanthus impetiginosus TaxID=429701 RepID=A0A2G9GI85_9LAMI|nr:hypothetical protein CDL12_22461 [Handroanthus impetiginosus]
MYPKVKVRVQREEADQYAYEKNSLESLKAFEWLSLHHVSSSDESPQPVVRVPRSYAPKSPTPSFLASKEETNKKKAVVEENQKNISASSAPRPRAVLSSPDNDEIIGSKAQARRELLSGLKNQNPCQNRHTQCKIFPKSESADSFGPAQGYSKESAEPKNSIRSKGRTTLADSITRAGFRKMMSPSAFQR